jgi:hypothetical protein
LAYAARLAGMDQVALEQALRTPDGPLPEVEVHANLVHMLVSRSFIRPSGWVASLGLQLPVVLPLVKVKGRP